MTVKEELHRLIDGLAEVEASEALEYVRWLASPGESLSQEKLAAARAGEAQIARGEYVTLEDLSRASRG
jgi:hypothetical protein